MNAVVLILGLAVVVAAIYAVLRGVDVRLALLLAAFTLGALAGQPAAILQKFLATFADEKYVVPICSSMGFAYVLRLTACDRHLVQLLCKPLRRIHALLIPGAVMVGFVVNIPIISQTSTAVAIGSVLIPLMFAAGLSPVTSGAALLLGASIGGELLNPGAPEYGTVVKEMSDLSATPITRAELVNHTLPLVLLQLAVATMIFWWLSAWAETRRHSAPPPTTTATTPRLDLESCEEVGFRVLPVEADHGAFKVNPIKAAVPFVPLAILFLTSKAFAVFALPQEWLVNPRELVDLSAKAALARGNELFDSRLIGAAMLIGVAAAALTLLLDRDGRRSGLDTAKAFFAGAGYAFAEIIAIIVAATCFAEGVKLIGVGQFIGALGTAVPGLLVPTAGLFPTAFAMVSGSGMAATQGLYGFFVAPAIAQNVDPAHIGSIVSVAAAAGRTMSPVAAVVLMCAKMTDTRPLDLVKRVAVPLLCGVLAMMLLGVMLSVAGKR